MGLGQVECADKIIQHKRWVGRSYNERLAAVSGLTLPIEKDWAKPIYWMYGVVLEGSHELDAAMFAERLSEKRVQSRPFFLGMHRQPGLWDLGVSNDEGFPVADLLAELGLYLPSGLALTEDQVDQVCDAVAEVLAKSRRFDRAPH